MRRLTNAEYLRTIRDITGVSVTTSFPAEQLIHGFEGRAGALPTNMFLLQAYESAALEAAGAIGGRLASFLACDPAASGESACAAGFIATFGQHAFRRPLTDQEKTTYLSLFTSVRVTLAFNNSIQTVVRALLQSPHFLYRPELGAAPASATADRVRLTPYETATRLSYLIWGSTPDAALLAAAQTQNLSTPQIEDQARRLLADPRARDGVKTFFRQWWDMERVGGVAKDAARFPNAGPVLQAAAEQGYRFITDVVFSGAGSFPALLSSNHTFVNADLAAVYGVAAPAGGWGRANLDPAQRSGVLTQPWFLAAAASDKATSPTQRGLFVRQRLLCQEVPAPPPEEPTLLPDDGSRTTRDRVEQTTAVSPMCRACHGPVDLIGFTFENYDALGAYRTTENGLPIDSSGNLVNTRDADGPVADAIALSNRLARSQEVSACFVRRWYELAHGRDSETEDSCRLTEIGRALTAANGDIKEMLIAIVASDDFSSRPAIRDAAAGPGTGITVMAGPTEPAIRKAILNLVIGELMRLAPRLPPSDRFTLEGHLVAAREWEIFLHMR